MAGDKYLYNNSGRITEKASIQSSSGAGDAGKIPSLDEAGRLHISMMPTGMGADTITAEASEALSAGDFVNLYNSSGLKMRKADAQTAGKEANGFVLSAVENGASGVAYRQGVNNQLSGMTVGARQYLTTTPGARSETAPSATGNVVQFLGIATSATELFFEERESVILA
jgi:hypothetical protein